jgi:hypothetical protein
MPRRKKKPTEPAESAAWESWRPHEARYWMYEGPWVPPDEIEPFATGQVAGDIRPYEKPATRAKSVGKMLDDARADLATSLAHYLDLHGRGVEALPNEWQRDAVRRGGGIPGDPNALHYHCGNTYGQIARLRRMIPVYEAILESLDSATLPLFHQPKKS